MIKHTLHLFLLFVFLVLQSNAGFASDALPSELLDNCTQSNFFDYENNKTQAQTLLQDIVNEIVVIVDNAIDRLYNAFVGDANYQTAIYAAFMLMVIFFAVSFMFGFVTLTLFQGLVRLIKLGFVAWIASPAGLNFMYSEEGIITFFDSGGACIIDAMIQISISGAVGTCNNTIAAPFAVLDSIIQIVFSPRMAVTIIGTLETGPFGPVMFFGLIWAVFSVFMAILKALNIYVVSIVVKAVLYGLAPVFIPMMLFERTKSLFTNWLNQLINFTLQPILLFAFISFFAALLTSAARDILPPDDVHLCYVRAGNQAATPFEIHRWKYMCCAGGTCQPYEGKWTQEGPINCPSAPIFPMNHVNILVFLLLTHIMRQLADVAVTIATELSQGVMKLNDFTGTVNSWFGSGGGGGGRGGGGRSESQRRRDAIRK